MKRSEIEGGVNNFECVQNVESFHKPIKKGLGIRFKNEDVIDHIIELGKTKPEVFHMWIVLNNLCEIGAYETHGEFKTPVYEALAKSFECVLKELEADDGKLTVEASERLLLSSLYWILFLYWVHQKKICVYDSES